MNTETMQSEKQRSATSNETKDYEVRQSWQDERVVEYVEVSPSMRRHVVGHRGDTLRSLHEKHSGVRVIVPPPLDRETTSVTLRGTKSRVKAAAQDIRALIKTVEAQLRITEQERQEAKHSLLVTVLPNERRFVVGYGGEALRRLKGEYPGIRITIPPPNDTESDTITLEGPREQVEGAALEITSRLSEVKESKPVHTPVSATPPEDSSPSE